MRNAAARRSLLALAVAAILTAAMSRNATAANPPTNTLWVSVVDSLHHRPIPFASVTVPDERRGGLTDTDGWCMLPHLHAEAHLVKVQYIGYMGWQAMVHMRAHPSDTLRVVLREMVVREVSPYELLPTIRVGGDTTYRLLPTTPRRRAVAVPAAAPKK